MPSGCGLRSILLLATLASCSAPHVPQSADNERPDKLEAKGAAIWRQEVAATNGAIAPRAHKTALEQREQNKAYWDTLDDGGINPLTWIDRGPDDLGGRCRALLIHPTITSRYYAGSVGGGIWRSDSGGSSWYPIGDDMPNLAIACMAFDPADPNTIYAGTGEGFNNVDAIRGAGIWRSTDAGDTWAQLSATDTAQFRYVSRIAISPVDSTRLLASTSTGTWLSTDTGANWTRTLVNRCYQVGWDPNNSSNVLATRRFWSSAASSWVHQAMYSTDGGSSFTAATGIPSTSRIELCYAPSTVDRVYATADNGGVYRSTDGGQTWALRGTLVDAQWWYNNCVWVDPTNSNRLVVGATSVWRSSDGGATWTECGDKGTTSPHADVHQIVAHPNYDAVNNRQVLLATDGGIYRTSNILTASSTAGATGWIARNQDLRVAQFYEADGDANLRVSGGLQDNGTMSIQSTSSQASVRYLGGDGFPAYTSASNSDFIYGAYQYSSPHRSTDGGLTGSAINAGIASNERGSQPAANPNPPFRTPLAHSDSDPNHLFMGSFSVWRCSDAAAASPSWTAIRGPLPQSSNDVWRVTAIATSPIDADAVWAAYWNRTTNTARISVTYNATAAAPIWYDFSMANFPSGRAVTRLVADLNVVVSCPVCFGGFNSIGLWRTSLLFSQADENLSGAGLTSLPAAPVYSVTQHPTIADRLYAATEVGVFSSQDDGQTWAAENGGPLDVACYDIRFANNTETLVLATHGRGIWTSEVVDPQVLSFGAGCPGTFGTPVLSATAPRIGATCVLTTTDCYPGGSVWLVQGTSNTSWGSLTLPLPLDAFGAAGCNLEVRPDIVRDGAADGAGVATASLPIPPSPAIVGQSIFFQSWAQDLVNGFGRVGSQGLELVVGQ